MNPFFRIGNDLGGTKIEAIALDPDGTVLWRHRIPTPSGDAVATIEAIRDLVFQAEAQLGAPGTVGVGTPGAPSPATGLLRNSNSVCLNGLPLDRLLAGALGREVRIANDANCFALSEATDGAAAGAAIVFGVILGTGVGGGLVVGGKILTGRHGISGEWGHNPLPWPAPGEWPGPTCYCGRTGCAELFLSGPGLAADHRATAGENLATHEIAARAETGDAPARATLDRYVDRLARGLAGVINLVDPDVIVLGGGLSNLTMLYEAVPARWARYVFSDVVTTRLVPPHHGDSSGVRGAAWLWPPD
ncbi:MAG TPA: ROK family protein [Aliidongia sp.]|uniref:ROK family protein n=1 Tax=Aliidongia sp. TaxID=1914230 RepID=UPI002DDCA94C|nr:ROK family protein [Aliidongia sp.]HEV2676811.1 ROK family protein [Aliidongia sp.]